MKIKSQQLAIIILLVIFGGVAFTSATGYWKTTNTKVPAKYSSGEFSGQYNPADIRGSYSFQEISQSFDIPLEDLGQAFGVEPERYATFQCKELETLYASLQAEDKEIGTGSVRYFVALYKGLPITVEENTYLPAQAVEILRSKAQLPSSQIESLQNVSLDISTRINTDLSPSQTASDSTAAPITESGEPKIESTQENTIKGKTTFQELLSWGVKKEDIEAVLQEQTPNPQMVIRDYAVEKGIEFSILKENLNQLLSKN